MSHNICINPELVLRVLSGIAWVLQLGWKSGTLFSLLDGQLRATLLAAVALTRIDCILFAGGLLAQAGKLVVGLSFCR